MQNCPYLQAQEQAELSVQAYPHVQTTPARPSCPCRSVVFRCIMLLLMLISGIVAGTAIYRYQQPDDVSKLASITALFDPQFKESHVKVIEISDGDKESQQYYIGPNYDTSRLEKLATDPTSYRLYPIWVKKSNEWSYPDLFAAQPLGALSQLRLALWSAAVCFAAALACLLSYVWRAKPLNASKADWVYPPDQSNFNIFCLIVPLCVFNILNFHSDAHTWAATLRFIVVIIIFLTIISFFLYSCGGRQEYFFKPQGITIATQLLRWTLSTKNIPLQEGDTIQLCTATRDEARAFLRSFKTILKQDELYHVVYLCRADGKREYLYHSTQEAEAKLFTQELRQAYPSI